MKLTNFRRLFRQLTSTTIYRLPPPTTTSHRGTIPITRGNNRHGLTTRRLYRLNNGNIRLTRKQMLFGSRFPITNNGSLRQITPPSTLNTTSLLKSRRPTGLISTTRSANYFRL